MNDEIKEIIELINTKYEDYYIDDFLSGGDVKKLVDYITNLQQRIDEAIQYIKCHTFLHNDYGNEYYTMGEYFSPNGCIDILNGNDEGLETLKTFIDYKERVRKAIQYIEEKGRLKYNPDELINILRGVS